MESEVVANEDMNSAEGRMEWKYQGVGISKKSVSEGVIGVKPHDGARCRIILSDVVMCKELRSVYFSPDFTGDVTIGLGSTPVDRALDCCLMSMCLDEEAAFVVLGISYTLKLIYIDNPPDVTEWSNEQLINWSEKLKSEGAKLYASGFFIDSFFCYRKSLQFLLMATNEVTPTQLHLYNNMAACQLSQMNYEHARDLASKVLMHEPHNVKALYRRARSYRALQEYEKAVADIERAINLEPTNSALSNEHAILYQEVNKCNKRLGNALSKMFV